MRAAKEKRIARDGEHETRRGSEAVKDYGETDDDIDLVKFARLRHGLMLAGNRCMKTRLFLLSARCMVTPSRVPCGTRSWELS